MGTLKQAVDRVAAAKTAIGNAIAAKGGTVGANDGLEEFAADIATIPSGGENNAKFVADLPEFSMAALESVEIPEGVTTISNSSFSPSMTWKCLKKIVIPSSMISITVIAFNYRMPNLEEIVIHKPEGSISGAPWGATNATVTWTG